uniref:Endonuclease III homolog n=1 Tax=Cacopsylla melanoneura TaxID=428564 RepID=A0A8D8M8N7_9HEMI
METRRSKMSTAVLTESTANGRQKRKPVNVQYDEIDGSSNILNKTDRTSTKKKVQREIEGKDEEESKKNKWEPENWNQVLQNIREMRKNLDAPVDSMGCDQSYDKDISPQIRRFHVLISLMLSSQTKDEVNHAAMCRLKEHGLTIENICNTPEEILGELIKPVGFWKTKAKHIKKVVEILKNDCNNDIPNTINTLCSLPGVGPKMAHLCMTHAWGIVTGIGVDVHVHRISHRLGWTKQLKTPEHTRQELESWLPEELWSEVNHLLVGFGQQICKSPRPLCETCLNKDLCPQGKKELSERKNKKTPKKKL